MSSWTMTVNTTFTMYANVLSQYFILDPVLTEIIRKPKVIHSDVEEAVNAE